MTRGVLLRRALAAMGLAAVGAPAAEAARSSAEGLLWPDSLDVATKVGRPKVRLHPSKVPWDGRSDVPLLVRMTGTFTPIYDPVNAPGFSHELTFWSDENDRYVLNRPGGEVTILRREQGRTPPWRVVAAGIPLSQLRLRNSGLRFDR